jgi:hypothetical protein
MSYAYVKWRCGAFTKALGTRPSVMASAASLGKLRSGINCNSAFHARKSVAASPIGHYKSDWARAMKRGCNRLPAADSHLHGSVRNGRSEETLQIDAASSEGRDASLRHRGTHRPVQTRTCDVKISTRARVCPLGCPRLKIHRLQSAYARSQNSTPLRSTGDCPGSGAAVRVPERRGELTRGSGNNLPLRGRISTLLF